MAVLFFALVLATSDMWAGDTTQDGYNSRPETVLVMQAFVPMTKPIGIPEVAVPQCAYNTEWPRVQLEGGVDRFLVPPNDCCNPPSCYATINL